MQLLHLATATCRGVRFQDLVRRRTSDPPIGCGSDYYRIRAQIGVMVTDQPSWIVTRSNNILFSADEREKRLQVRPRQSRRLPAVLEFGDVPDGWRIEIDEGGQGQALSLRAESVGRGSTWRLGNVGRYPITLGRSITVVYIDPGPSILASVKLSANNSQLHLSSGKYDISGSVGESGQPRSFALRANGSIGQQPIDVRGNAFINALSGEGDVIYANDIDLAAAKLHGSLTAQAVRIGNLAVAGSLTCHGLKASRAKLKEELYGGPSVLGPETLDKDHVVLRVVADTRQLHERRVRTAQPVWKLWGLSTDRTPASNYTIGIDSIDVMVAMRGTGERRALSVGDAPGDGRRSGGGAPPPAPPPPPASGSSTPTATTRHS
jgi:hypothetical protein